MRLSDFLNYDDIVIQCHDNPDADALASGFGVYCYLKSHGKEASLVYAGQNVIRKSNLLLMVDSLSIPVQHVTQLHTPDLLIMVDCQYGSGNVTKFEAKNVAVIDHHRICVKLPRLNRVMSKLGACATLVWQMLLEEGYEVNKDERLATALYYGLYIDTNGLSELAHPLDKDIRDTIAFSEELIRRYRNANLSLEELETAGAALLQTEYNDEYRFAVVKAGTCDPNLLGIISDLVLVVDSVDICLVFSMIPGGVKLSVRSCVKEVKANELAEDICKDIGSGGGHFMKAGGFIDMGLLKEQYLIWCKERKVTPRLELAPSGECMHPSASAIKSFLTNRMLMYFKDTEVIYAKNYVPNMSEMQEYYSVPIPIGYVYGRDMFEVGTAVTVRSIEADLDTKIEKDLIFLIGIKGEVYPIHEDKFKKEYHVFDEKYCLKNYEYNPTIRDNEKDQVLSPLLYAKVCIPCMHARIFAKKLTHNVKIFTAWDESKYVRGRVGDYLMVRGTDLRYVHTLESSIFEEIYQKVDEYMEKKDVKAIIFDLDGTLLDTLQDLMDAVNEALRAHGMKQRSLEEVRSFVGNGIARLMERSVEEGTSAEKVQRVLETFQGYYQEHCNDKTDAYPQIRLLLQELSQRGIQMAIVSNKVDAAVKALNQIYFKDYIPVAIGESEQVKRKPAKDALVMAMQQLGVAPEHVVYVGDSDVDIQTAKNAGVDCISVTWGFRDREFLKEHGAQVMIDSPIELLTYL